MGAVRTSGERRGRVLRLAGFPAVLGLLAWAGAVVAAPGAAAAPVVTATIPVGQFPGGVAVNPVTGTVYATGNVLSSGIVSVISGRTDTVTATIPVGPDPGGVAVNPLTGTVYVTNTGSDTVSVIPGPRFPWFP
jgi:YVTN family beta-propeller protein